jgi:hypothetical protein
MIGVGGTLVGVWIGVHACMALTTEAWHWSLFGVTLGIFHLGEFAVTAWLRPAEVNFDCERSRHRKPLPAQSRVAELQRIASTTARPTE